MTFIVICYNRYTNEFLVKRFMVEKKYVLFDGQELSQSDLYFMNGYFLAQGRDIFNMYNSKLTLKYVGYLEFIIEDVKYILYCFPKEYVITLQSGISISRNEDNRVVKAKEFLQIEREFKVVMEAIKKANNSGSNNGQSNLSGFYASNLYYLNEVIEHYYQFGAILEAEVEYEHKQLGKVNWSKTIAKIIPKSINNNLIYDSFITEKKNHETSILTKIIAKVIFEGTTKYSFYLPIINLEIDYTDIANFSNTYLIEVLLQIRNHTFKDYLHHVIDNLVSYLQDEITCSETGILVGTNKFEKIWEKIVEVDFGEGFISQKSYRVGTNANGGSVDIIIDHLNVSKQIIADSKYYNEIEKERLDYKQIFYNNFIVYETYIKHNSNNEKFLYKDVRDEYAIWSNILVMPTKKANHELKTQMYEGLSLTTKKINMTQAVLNYID